MERISRGIAVPKILLVQNVQTRGNSIRTDLECLGLDVIRAGSGLTALKVADNVTIDLILLDIAMPETEGIELCRMFQKSADFRSTPIVMLVGRGFKPESLRTSAYRPDAYIEKPYTEHDLNSKIFALLKARRPDASPASSPSQGAKSDSKQEEASASAQEPKPGQKPVLRLVPKSDAASESAASQNAEAAVIDAATGLFSKQQFEAMFSKSFKQCLRFKQNMSCMLIDLDGTKMGRKADSDLIKSIVALVQTTIREVDTAAWWTGESLVVLLPNTLGHDAVQAAARILETVATHQFTWPDATRVTMSIGVAGLPDRNIDSEKKLLEAAALASRNALDKMAPVPKALDGLKRKQEELIKKNSVVEKLKK